MALVLFEALGPERTFAGRDSFLQTSNEILDATCTGFRDGHASIHAIGVLGQRLLGEGEGPRAGSGLHGAISEFLRFLLRRKGWSLFQRFLQARPVERCEKRVDFFDAFELLPPA